METLHACRCANTEPFCLCEESELNAVLLCLLAMTWGIPSLNEKPPAAQEQKEQVERVPVEPLDASKKKSECEERWEKCKEAWLSCDEDENEEDSEHSCKYWLCCIHVKYFVPTYALLNLLIVVMLIVVTALHLASAMHRMQREVIEHNNYYHNGDQHYHEEWRSRFLGMSFEYEPRFVHAYSDGRHHTRKIDADVPDPQIDYVGYVLATNGTEIDMNATSATVEKDQLLERAHNTRYLQEMIEVSPYQCTMLGFGRNGRYYVYSIFSLTVLAVALAMLLIGSIKLRPGFILVFLFVHSLMILFTFVLSVSVGYQIYRWRQLVIPARNACGRVWTELIWDLIVLVAVNKMHNYTVYKRQKQVEKRMKNIISDTKTCEEKKKKCIVIGSEHASQQQAPVYDERQYEPTAPQLYPTIEQGEEKKQTLA